MGITLKHNGPSKAWSAIMSNSDGTKLIAVGPGSTASQIYLSTDSGITWTLNTAAGEKLWSQLGVGITISDDGTKLAAYVQNGSIWTSSNSGASWTERTGAGTRAWRFLAASADGTRLVAGVYSGYAYTSADSGATWTERTGAGTLYWKHAAISS